MPRRYAAIVRRHALQALVALTLGFTVGLAVPTWQSLMPLPAGLQAKAIRNVSFRPEVVAADGTLLSISFEGALNHTTEKTLSDVPLLLRQAFVTAEDKRYWEHNGVDWRARLAALWGNLRTRRVHRGASTIAEQAARIISPRPRSYWGHWTAGWDARRLIRRFDHASVLEFYLNQVPYAAQRRGVAQAARYYFGRELHALNAAEQLALAVLIRSPSRYDPRRHHQALRRAIDHLATRMADENVVTPAQAAMIQQTALRPGEQTFPVPAGTFVVHARKQGQEQGLSSPVIQTTLDPDLQAFVQQVLRTQTRALSRQGVRDAAALVVNNATGDILAWASAPGTTPHGIDPVITSRQPGSTLKPFVYGLAMATLGWQPDQILDDTPMVERINTGVHSYRNYSGQFHGRVSLRYALGNSLNIPVLRAAQAVGVPSLIDLFKRLGFTHFTKGADHYGAAIALGDGAVSLYELVQAYATLARGGQYLPLRALHHTTTPDPVHVLPAPVASVLGSILSDPNARSIEFGTNSILNLPHPTAAKTGTSSNYHDAWTVAYDDRFTVGVWMGRLDGAATDAVTGSMGPAPVMRQIFSQLRKQAPYAGLWVSPELTRVSTCQWLGAPPCIQRQDWRLPATMPDAKALDVPDVSATATIVRPVNGEVLAIDPRVPRNAQRFQFTLRTSTRAIQRVVWRVDDQVLPGNHELTAAWTLEPGIHQVRADVFMEHANAPIQTPTVRFQVRGTGPDSP